MMNNHFKQATHNQHLVLKDPSFVAISFIFFCCVTELAVSIKLYHRKCTHACSSALSLPVARAYQSFAGSVAYILSQRCSLRDVPLGAVQSSQLQQISGLWRTMPRWSLCTCGWGFFLLGVELPGLLGWSVSRLRSSSKVGVEPHVAVTSKRER